MWFCEIVFISFVILGYFLYTNAKFSQNENAHATIMGPWVDGKTFGRNCMQFQFQFQVHKIIINDNILYLIINNFM